MVECGGLENRCRRKAIAGSNPAPSVLSLLKRYLNFGEVA